MYKNRLYCVLTIVILVAMVLSACKGKAAQIPTTPSQPTVALTQQQPTEAPTAALTTASEDAWANVDPSGQTISFWHNYSGDRQKALAEIVDEFNKTNPYGITVKEEYQGSYNDIFKKMLTLINTPDVPSMVVAYQNQAATYQVANALVDMNPLVNSSKWGLSEAEQADFFPGFWKQDIFPLFNYARLGFPPNRSMEVMYYNMDWLAELKDAGKIDFEGPPQTPEQFKAAACAAPQNPFSKASAQGNIGYELGTSDASHVAAWIFAFGSDIYDYVDNQFTYNSDGAKAALALLQGLFKGGCATIVTGNYGDQTDFGAGKLLFTTSSTSGLAFYKTAVDSGAKFNWSVAAIPHITKDPMMNIYGASISIPKGAPEKELASWLFIKYYTSPEIQAEWAQASICFPARSSAAEGLTDYFAANPAYKTAFELLKFGHFEPLVPGYDFVRQKVSETIYALITEPYPDVEAGLDELNAIANELLTQQMMVVPYPTPTATLKP